jgi:hypothetical protein
MEELQAPSIEYIHHVPGRLRVRVPEVRRNPTAAASLEQVLQDTPGVRSVEARELTGSVVILYDRSRTNAIAVVRILDDHRGRFQSADARQGGTPPLAPPLATQALIRSRANRNAGRPPVGIRHKDGSSTFGSELASWVLKKSIEIALERSLVLLIAAVL